MKEFSVHYPERAGPQRIFLSICRHGSFVAAAGSLNLTASAVAKAISRLETRLGVRLFERTTRRMALTPEGVRYRDVCDKALADIDTIETELTAASTTPIGLVRISLPPLLGAAMIAPALLKLSCDYPNLSLDISLATAKVDLLANETDIAVRIGPPATAGGLSMRRLGTQVVIACASRSYLEHHGVPQDIEGLKHHCLIATSRGGATLPWSVCGSDGFVQSWVPPARLYLDGSVLTLEAIRQGHGVGLLPAWLAADDLASGLLQPVLSGAIGGNLPIHVLWRTALVMLPRIRVTIDAIVDATRISLSKIG